MPDDACLLVGVGTLFGRLLTYCMLSLGVPLPFLLPGVNSIPGPPLSSLLPRPST
jgi:hypothetical protein